MRRQGSKSCHSGGAAATVAIAECPRRWRRVFFQHHFQHYTPSILSLSTAHVKPTMARRIPSIFSLGSNRSDHSSDVPRPLSSFDPDRPPKDFYAVHLERNSTPDLRRFTPSPSAQSLHSSQLSNELPSTDMQFLSVPGIIDGGPQFLQPPQLLKPLPHPLDYPGGSRLLRGANGSDGRPVSRDSSSRGSSTAGSISGSRSTSPSHIQPVATTNESRASKRRSWLPTKSRAESIDESQDVHSARAWIMTSDPRDKIDYDLSTLLNFQKVR